MKVTVTGATGLVGANLVALLCEAGREVRCTRRGTSRAEHLSHLPVEWVEADLADPEALTRAFEGAEQVYHCAAAVTVLEEAPPWVVETNIEGTGNVLRALQRSGAGRLIYCSSTVAVGVSEDAEPCNESSRWNLKEHGLDDGYATTKYQAELLVKAAAASGMDAVVVNPGFMFGPYDARPSSGRMILEVIRGRVVGYTPGSNNFVDVRDVCRGMMAAAERGRSGERYILGGENLTYREIFERIARVAKVKPPRLAVPWFGASTAAMIGDLYQMATGKEAALNSATARWAWCPGFRFRSEKARLELGYNPGPVEPAIRAAIDWFQERGMLA